MPESVSDAVVFAFAEGWPGEPSTGAPKMPVEFVKQYLERLNGRREWPRDWKRHLVAYWRVRFRTWDLGSEKNGGAPVVNPSVAMVNANQRRRTIQTELAELQEEIESLRNTGDERPLEERERELQKELASLT